MYQQISTYGIQILGELRVVCKYDAHFILPLSFFTFLVTIKL